MINPKQAPSLEEARAYINAIDFSMIVDKIVKTKKWQKKDVLAICAYYKNFLFLNKKYQEEFGNLPPSEEIDEFWHNHILDTKKYHEDCDKIFGCYLHHYPYFGMDDQSNEQDLAHAFEHMQALYKKEFGDYVYRVRKLSFYEVAVISVEIIKEFFTRKVFFIKRNVK